MTPIERHIELLQAEHASLPGFSTSKAPVKYPDSIAYHPTVLVFPGEGDAWLDTFATDQKLPWGMIQRNYDVRVYVEPVGKHGLGGKLGKVNKRLSDFQNLYLSLANAGLDGNMNEYPNIEMHEEFAASDTGSVVLDYGKQLFHGFEFKVRILDQIRET